MKQKQRVIDITVILSRDVYFQTKISFWLPWNYLVLILIINLDYL